MAKGERKRKMKRAGGVLYRLVHKSHIPAKNGRHIGDFQSEYNKLLEILNEKNR